MQAQVGVTCDEFATTCRISAGDNLVKFGTYMASSGVATLIGGTRLVYRARRFWLVQMGAGRYVSQAHGEP
jgi:hypothetical protein